MTRRLLVLVIAVTLVGLPPAALSATYDADEPANDPAVRKAAHDLYDVEDPKIYEADAPNFEEAFPDRVELFYVLDRVRTPAITHSMAYDAFTGQAYDATEDYDALLDRFSGPFLEESQAIEHAKAYAEVAYTEILPQKVVVSEDQADDFDEGIFGPRASSDLEGWDAELFTFSPRNGVLAEWDIEFVQGGINDGEWEVVHTHQANSPTEPYAPIIEDGTWIDGNYDNDLLNVPVLDSFELKVYEETENNELREIPYAAESVRPGTATDTIASRENSFDDTRWQVLHNGTADASEQAQAAALAEAGVSAYDELTEQAPCPVGVGPGEDEDPGSNPDASFGFHEHDADCEYQLRLHDDSILYPRLAVERGDDVVIHVTEGYLDTLRERGLYTGTEHNLSTVSDALVANAYYRHHAAQREVPDVPALRDGLARLAAAVAHPDVEHEPTSLFYGAMQGSPAGDSSIANAQPHLQGADQLAAVPEAGVCPGLDEDTDRPSRPVHAGSAGLLFGHHAHRTEAAVGPQLREALDQLDRAVTNGDLAEHCDPAAIETATAALGDDTSTSNLTGFGQALATREINWSTENTTRDWGPLLGPVASQPLASESATATDSLGPWGLAFTDLPDSGTFHVACDLDEGLRAQVIGVVPEGATKVLEGYCQDEPRIDASLFDELTFNVVNEQPSEAGYELELER